MKTKIFSNKVRLVPIEKRAKLCGATRRSLTQKHNQIARTRNQTIRSKKIPKKYVEYLKILGSVYVKQSKFARTVS
jgi:hypothetical protein